MANKDGKKKTSGIRNEGRKNGKKFNKKRWNLDDKGRPKTGRGKPSGRSRKGMRVSDAEKQTFQLLYNGDAIDLTRVKVAA